MTEQPSTTPNNAFLDALSELRGGDVLADLHQALQQLVGDVRSLAKPGTLSLTLKVALAKGSTTTLILLDKIDLKTPEPDKEATFLYADDNNRLSRRDPRQPQLGGLAQPPTAEVHIWPIAVNQHTGEIHE